MKLSFIKKCMIDEDLNSLDEQTFYVNFGYIVKIPNVFEFCTKEWNDSWSWMSGWNDVHRVIDENSITDFISQVVTQQPKKIIINLETKNVWNTEAGKTMINTLKSMAEEVEILK